MLTEVSTKVLFFEAQLSSKWWHRVLVAFTVEAAVAASKGQVCVRSEIESSIRASLSMKAKFLDAPISQSRVLKHYLRFVWLAES